ncbi:MAG: PDZ domain-containing protein [Bryobacteraceae bacterium]
MEGRGGSFLGVGVQEIDDARAKELKLPETRGVEVTRVVGESPAIKAGLKEGDVVLEYNGERVDGVEQFVRLVRETPPGRQVKLSISRNGVVQTVTATIAKKPQGFHMDPNFERDMQKFGEEMRHQFGPDSPFQHDMQKFGEEMRHKFGPDSEFHREMEQFGEDLGGRIRAEVRVRQIGPGGASGRLGIEAEPVTEQLAEFFGVKQGVLVRSVNASSPAEKAGIRAGDVIVKVGAAEVARASEIGRALREAEAGKPVPVVVVRNKKPMTLNVTVEKPAAPAAESGPRRPQAPLRHNFMPSPGGRLVSHEESF